MNNRRPTHAPDRISERSTRPTNVLNRRLQDKRQLGLQTPKQKQKNACHYDVFNARHSFLRWHLPMLAKTQTPAHACLVRAFVTSPYPFYNTLTVPASNTIYLGCRCTFFESDLGSIAVGLAICSSAVLLSLLCLGRGFQQTLVHRNQFFGC